MTQRPATTAKVMTLSPNRLTEPPVSRSSIAIATNNDTPGCRCVRRSFLWAVVVLANAMVGRYLLAEVPVQKFGNRQPTAFVLAKGSINAIASCPPAGMAAWGDDNGDITVWSFSEDMAVMAIKYPGKVSSMAMSNKGQYLACAASDMSVIEVYETKTGRHVSSLRTPGDSSFVSSLSFSADDKNLAAGMDSGGWFHVYDVASGQEVFSGRHAAGRVSVEFTKSPAFLFTGGTNGVIMRRSLTSRETAALPRVHPTHVYRLSSSSDGRTLVSCGLHDGVIAVWDSHDGRRLDSIKVDSVVYGVSISPDSRYIIAGCGTVAKIRSKKNDGIVHVFQRANSSHSLLWSMDIEKYQVTAVEFVNNHSFIALGLGRLHLIKFPESSGARSKSTLNKENSFRR